MDKNVTSMSEFRRKVQLMRQKSTQCPGDYTPQVSQVMRGMGHQSLQVNAGKVSHPGKETRTAKRVVRI